MNRWEKAKRRREAAAQDARDTHWTTPDDFYAVIHAEFAPVFDLCASATSAKCPLYFTRHDDALRQAWTRRYHAYWMNPPYHDLMAGLPGVVR